MEFNLLKTDAETKARVGVITAVHVTIETPILCLLTLVSASNNFQSCLNKKY